MIARLITLPTTVFSADHRSKDAQRGGVPPGSPDSRTSARRTETWRANDPGSQGALVPRALL